MISILIIRQLTIWLIQKMSVGSDDFVVTSRVQNQSNDHICQSWLIGRGEAHITALVAAKTIQLLLKKDIPDGIYHIEQLFDLDTFLSFLNLHQINDNFLHVVKQTTLY